MNHAIVTGPWQSTFPWWVEVRDEDGQTVDVELPSGGLHREKSEAQAQADEFNVSQQ